ncbi:MAG: hypothetical protein VR70_12110 [Rhodospirillaceae bacterium BRH_c57]|nr:MAG: hypothetical protein VR70_12110 [Rhodospirillaceae bacterium BRH_c57]
MTLREHQERIAHYRWAPLTLEEARAIHPGEDVDQVFARQAKAAAPPTGAAAIRARAADGQTQVSQGGVVIVTLPWETDDQVVISAAVVGVHAGITLVDRAAADRQDQ